MSAIMASDSPEDFPSLKLRFRLSFFPGSHHVPYTTITPNVCENTHNIKFHVSSNKTQDMHTKNQTEKYRNQAKQEQLQLFFMMSPSDLSATPSSECLQERCSRYRH